MLKGNCDIVDVVDDQISREMGRKYMLDAANKEKAKHHHALAELPNFEGQMKQYYDHWEKPREMVPPPLPGRDTTPQNDGYNKILWIFSRGRGGKTWFNFL